MTKERIMEILISYIDHDLNQAEVEFVKDTLTNPEYCGCSDEELKILGIYDWLGFEE